MNALQWLPAAADAPVEWRLRRTLGVGGMARVLLAEQWRGAQFERLVAIKRMHEHLAQDEELVRMFFDESRIASAIVHANVVRVLDVPVREGERFIVMEYVEGMSLARIIERVHGRGERVPHGVSVRVLCDMLRGLHAAHEARDGEGRPLGIVHRDVAPQNVLVSSAGVARITDFGVARASGRLTVTAPGATKGHLAYSAPEVVRGDEVTRRADVFSAGVILWELLSGRPLMAAASPAQTLRNVATRRIPSTIDAPAVLSTVCARALDRDPARRYPTARAFALALDEAAAQVGLRSLRSDARALVLDMRGETTTQRQPPPHPSGRYVRRTVSRPPSDAERARSAPPPAEALPRRAYAAQCALAAALATTALAAMWFGGSWVWRSLRAYPSPVTASSAPARETPPEVPLPVASPPLVAPPPVSSMQPAQKRKGRGRAADRPGHSAGPLPPNPY